MEFGELFIYAELFQFISKLAWLCFHDIFWISGFPIWVSLLGIIFFEVIDRDEDGILEFDEISNYYKGLVGVKDEDLYVVSKEGYRALTAVRKCFFAHK